MSCSSTRTARRFPSRRAMASPSTNGSTYAPTESLGLYMYQKPTTAKKLYFDVIPRAVDEYFTFLAAYNRQDWKERLGNPVWHMFYGSPPSEDMPVPFSLLLNLVSASNAHDKNVLWGFISRYAPGVTAKTHPKLDELTGYAIRYFDDFVKPTKVFRAPDDVEREALARFGRKARRRCRRARMATPSRTPSSTLPAPLRVIRIMTRRALKAGPECRWRFSRCCIRC